MKKLKLPSRLRYRNPVHYPMRWMDWVVVLYYGNGDIAVANDITEQYRELTFNLG